MTRQMTEEEKILSKQLTDSMNKKGDEFKEIVNNNPDKRIYKHKLLIEWAEIVDVKKEDLRFVENKEDKEFNRNLIRSKITEYGVEALKIALSIQENEKFSISEYLYAGDAFPNAVPPCLDGPASLIESIKRAARAHGVPVEIVTHDDIINEEIEQEHAEAELRANTDNEAVDSFLNGETDELPEGAEEISEEEAVALENQAAAGVAN